MLSNSADRVQGELVAVIYHHIGSVICSAVFGSIGGRAPGGAVGHQNEAALGILRTVLPILRQVGDVKGGPKYVAHILTGIGGFRIGTNIVPGQAH